MWFAMSDINVCALFYGEILHNNEIKGSDLVIVCYVIS